MGWFSWLLGVYSSLEACSVVSNANRGTYVSDWLPIYATELNYIFLFTLFLQDVQFNLFRIEIQKYFQLFSNSDVSGFSNYNNNEFKLGLHKEKTSIKDWLEKVDYTCKMEYLSSIEKGLAER